MELLASRRAIDAADAARLASASSAVDLARFAGASLEVELSSRGTSACGLAAFAAGGETRFLDGVFFLTLKHEEIHSSRRNRFFRIVSLSTAETAGTGAPTPGIPGSQGEGNTATSPWISDLRT